MEHLYDLARPIKCLITDLDGVLTNGNLYYSPEGEHHKGFSVQDGLGLKLLQKSGIEIAVITASNTPIVSHRLESLKIEHVYQGQINKLEAFDDVLSKLSLTDADVAYVGDDWPDLPLIRRAHFGVTVANGIDQVKAEADWVTTKSGGAGAMRELCDLILTAQGTYAKVLESYGV